MIYYDDPDIIWKIIDFNNINVFFNCSAITRYWKWDWWLTERTIITREDEIIISQKFYEICGKNFKITSSMALFNQGWMTVTRTG